jgi:membrane-associated protease RseP (regulator of RpoE activity)
MKDSTSNAKKILVLVLIIISFVALYAIRVANNVRIVYRVALALVMLVVVGMVIQKLLKLQGGYGFYMFGSKKGLATIDNTAKKHNVFWDVMSMWGLTLGFGLLTYPLMKGKIDKRVYVAGIISLILIMLFVTQYLATALQFVNLPQIQSAAASASTQTGPSILTYILLAVTIIAGFSGYIFAALFVSTETILWSIIQFATTPSAAAATTVTNHLGVAPVLPGIDIPFFAGVIALVVLLTIHEFSHGVLARKAKVKLKSIGILVFGSVPVGGYVEPDEKMVNKLDNIKQTRIFSAGISANFIAMIVFFLLTFVFTTFLLPSIYQYKVLITGILPNYPANGVLQSGMQILKWNNITMNSPANLTAAKATDRPNSTVSILTNTGLYKIKAIPNPSNSSEGLIGVSLGYQYSPITTSLYAGILYFLYTVFALSMLLNFLVAVINLLPVPGLDGWRIYYANIKSTKLINFLGALVIILIIINIIPVFFYL